LLVKSFPNYRDTDENQKYSAEMITLLLALSIIVDRAGSNAMQHGKSA
jgi:hypothetical protein